MQDVSEAEKSGSRQPSASLRIIYDGECPVCSAYVRLVRLGKAAGSVAITDARQSPEVVKSLRARGIDVNDTMVVEYGGETYTGPRAVELLSLLSSKSGVLNRLLARLLRDRRRANLIYPWLRRGRNLLLRLLGRKPIELNQ